MTDRTDDTTTELLDYRQLFEHLPAAYIIFKADDPKFTFTEVSDAHSALTGIARDKIIGRPFLEVFPDTSEQYKKTGVSEVVEMLRRVVRTKQVEQLDAFRYDVPNGNGGFIEKYWRPVHYPIADANGRITHILQSTEDVTTDNVSNRQLKAVQEQLDEALEIGKIGRWFWDVQKDKVIANVALCDLFGISHSKGLKGIPIAEFLEAIHPDDVKRVTKEIQNAVKTKQPYESDYRTLDKQGKVHWLITRGRVEADPHGKIVRFPGVAVDITERHEFERQIEAARLRDEKNSVEASLLMARNNELEELSRTKDEFVALASHQLRTPATAVKQYIGMVLQGYVGNISEVQTEMLDKAFQSNERQIQIINQILNAARVDTGRLVMTLAPIDVTGLIRSLCDDIKADVERHGHAFNVTLPDVPVNVTADSGYLRMAIENLIHNASIYTSEGGQVSVRLTVGGGLAKIAVKDSGVGIAPEDLKRLFTKFSRIHNPLSVQAGGSGIGLYLAQEIAHLHSGQITVLSKLGVGTTFTIAIPLLKNDSKKAKA